MRSYSSWLLAGAALLPLAAPMAVQAQAYRVHYDHVLGSSLDIVAVATSEASALMATTAIRREIDRLDPLLSAWRQDSELEQLNRSDVTQVSPALYEVLARSEAWRAVTDGAFDCRMGGALNLWRQAQFTGARIDPALLNKTMADSRQAVGLDPAGRTVSRPEGVRLTIDGIAKGYVIDAALLAARQASPDLRGLMIDIGGDLRCWGDAPEAGGWRVGVAEGPAADNAAVQTILRLGNQAVAASGRGPRDLITVDGPVSHNLIPVSGQPASLRHAVVVADSAADADALATAFMAMSAPRAIALADRLDRVEAQVTDGAGVRHVSKGWADLQHPAPNPLLIRASFGASAIAIGAAAAAVAPKAVSLDIAYQVPKIDAEPYHQPYMVMWITDEDRKLVRTLLALGVKPKWASENFIWWRRYGREKPQVLDTVARPTRAPGKYAAHWDGKDDAGNPAPAGKYILHIEAAREKGGHTYQTIDLDFTGAPGARTLPAKDEMGAIDVKFGS